MLIDSNLKQENVPASSSWMLQIGRDMQSDLLRISRTQDYPDYVLDNLRNAAHALVAVAAMNTVLSPINAGSYSEDATVWKINGRFIIRDSNKPPYDEAIRVGQLKDILFK